MIGYFCCLQEMETLLGRNRETNNHLYQSLEPTILHSTNSLDRYPESVATKTVRLQFQNDLQTRHKRRQVQRIKQAARVLPC